MKLVVLLLALAVVGCDEDEPVAATPAEPQSRTIDDDVPRNLRLACQLDRDAGGSSIDNHPIIAVEQMPPHIPAAFLSAEDRRFYERATLDWLTAWSLRSEPIGQRRSPIIQQLVSQRCMGQGIADKSRRKRRQAILAVRLELELTRAQILSIYLSNIYLGHGAYGVAEAAKTYFGKELERLTIAEAALLAGLVASPTKYAPHHNMPAALQRQRYVLSKMREDHYISEAEYQAALTEPISIVGETTP